MKFEDLKEAKCEWLRGSGRYSGISLCSRVRLARNIDGIPFPGRASGSQLARVAEMVLGAASRVKMLGEVLIVRMDELDRTDRQFLAERHLVSREFASADSAGVVIIGEKEVVSIMVNEEDHLRLQVMQSGFRVADAWQMADRIDTELGRELKFAYSGTWGFLTSCPTNVGTGLRTSIMLHLPALVASKRIANVLSRIAGTGITPRGAYGEGSEPSGDLFQISNQATLGAGEEEIAEKMEETGGNLIREEESARDYFLNRNREKLEDRVFRAYGILKNARLISSNEALECFSRIKMGIQTGLIEMDEALVNGLIISTQPAHLQKILGMKLSQRERDVRRADFIRMKLKESGGGEL